VAGLTDFLDPSGLLAIFEDGNAYNDPNYNNPAYNDAMARALAATNDRDHYEALYEAQEILMTDLPIIPVYHYSLIPCCPARRFRVGNAASSAVLTSATLLLFANRM
jgi:ABC-type oligopeptide transport system substrate-binding subunit